MKTPEQGRILKAAAVGATRPVGDATPTAVDPPRARVVKAAVQSATQEARAILHTATTEADRLLSEAKTQVAAITAAAKQQGLAEAQAQVNLCVEQLHKACQQAEAAQGVRVIELAQLIAERLIAETVFEHQATLHALADCVMEEARGARTVTLYVHPASAEWLRGWVATATRAAGATASTDVETKVRVKADAALTLGDVRLETDIGTVHANLRARIERLGQTLRRDLTQTR